MEGMTVFFKPKGKSDYETQYYSILSTEKCQDGRVVYANTKMVLDNLRDQLKVEDGILLKILDDSDGCAMQYRCTTALNMLHKLVEENNIIYDRAIDAEGHGKKTSDGKGGDDEDELSKQFQNNVEYQLEAFKDHKHFLFLYNIDNGNMIDFAAICTHVLEYPTRGQMVPPNHKSRLRK